MPSLPLYVLCKRETTSATDVRTAHATSIVSQSQAFRFRSQHSPGGYGDQFSFYFQSQSLLQLFHLPLFLLKEPLFLLGDPIGHAAELLLQAVDLLARSATLGKGPRPLPLAFGVLPLIFHTPQLVLQLQEGL